jgi:DNA repair protein RadC
MNDDKYLYASNFGCRKYKNVKLKYTTDIVPLLKPFRAKMQEFFLVASLTSLSSIIQIRVSSIGNLYETLVTPREVFAPAIVDRADFIIVAHNHPSGSIKPSKADNKITRQLVNCGYLLEIQVLDHIILTKDSYFSYSSHNKIISHK